MPEELNPVQPVEEKPWGKANPLRGINFIDHAIAFGREFPIGTVLSVENFDRWAAGRGLFVLPPKGAPKSGDTWLAHLQRRHQVRHNLCKASAHPRMETPYTIQSLTGHAKFEVMSPEQAVSRNNIIRRLDNLLNTKRKQLNYLMQSADFGILPPEEKAVAESIYDDIEGFSRRVHLETELLDNKLYKLQARIRQSLERGEIRPQNRSFQRLIEFPEEIASMEEDAEQTEEEEP